MKFSPFAVSNRSRHQRSRETLALLVACLAVATQLAACKSAPVPKPAVAFATPPQAQSPRQTATQPASQPATQSSNGIADRNVFTAQLMKASGLGPAVLLRPAATTDVILTATWCPACMQLEHVLRDPAVAPYLRGRNVAFLFVNEHLMQGAPQELKTGVNPNVLSSYLLHPEGIRNLPGPVYLWTDQPAGQYEFPLVFTANGSMGGLNWLTKGLGVPQETVWRALSEDHR
jgi:hypothetical protein